MNKVKKIIILLSIIMLIGSIFASKTYAALNCNVNLSKSKDKFTYKEQFSIYVSISNLQTTKGIIAIGATLSYDTKSLTLVSIEGENKWSDPFHNSSNGKITSFKNKLSTSNENVFKITFEVNEKGKAGESAWIKIDNFEISDGDEEKNCGGSSISISIGEASDSNSDNNSQGGNNQGGNADNNQGGNSQGGSSDNNQSASDQESNSNNNQSGSASGSNNQGSSTTKKPSTGSNTTKKPTSNSTNKNTNKEESSNNNNNEQANIVENVTQEEPKNDNNIVIVQNNSIQNNLEEDNINQEETKKDNKGQFYIVSIVTIAVIIVILLLIKKCWKTN